MKLVVAVVVVAAVMAAPATASAPTMGGLQRQITALRAEIAQLRTDDAANKTVQTRTQDTITCNYAIGADNLNSVWHTLVLLAQNDGFPAQPDLPRFDDQGACARLGVTRSR